MLHMISHPNRALLIITVLIASGSLGDVVHKPLAELGMGGGGGYFQDYPASDQQHLKGVGFPFFIYRGEIFRADERGGASARVISTVVWTFDLGFTGSFPTSSNDNMARVGMPNLDWLIELGPRLGFYFFRLSDGGGLAIRA